MWCPALKFKPHKVVERRADHCVAFASCLGPQPSGYLARQPGAKQFDLCHHLGQFEETLEAHGVFPQWFSCLAPKLTSDARRARDFDARISTIPGAGKQP